MGVQSAHCCAGVEMGADLPQRGSRAQRPLHIPRPVIDGVAGAAAGFVSRMAVQPFDVLKIRFQVQLEPVSKVLAPTSPAGPSKYTGLLQATGIIVKEEGWKGLWKGIVPAQLLVVPYTAIQFVVVHKFKSLVAKSPREGRLSDLNAYVQQWRVYVVVSLCLELAVDLRNVVVNVDNLYFGVHEWSWYCSVQVIPQLCLEHVAMRFRQSTGRGNGHPLEVRERQRLRRMVQSHEDATRALNARLLDLERAVPGPAAGASSSAPSSRQLEDRVDHLVAMLGDISTFAAPTTTISSQLHTLKTEVQQLQTTNADGNPEMYKMPTFNLERFDDYTQQDPVLWWEAFTTQLRILPLAKHAYIGALLLNSKGGCQTWLSHLATSHGVDVPDLEGQNHMGGTDTTVEEAVHRQRRADTRHQPSVHHVTGQHCNTGLVHGVAEDCGSTNWSATAALRCSPNRTVEITQQPLQHQVTEIRWLLSSHEATTSSATMGRRNPHRRPEMDSQYKFHGSSLACLRWSTRSAAATAAATGATAPSTRPPCAKIRARRMCDPASAWETELRGRAPLMDAGAEVVDLHAYIAKIDREFKTQRYDDIDAPLLYIRIQIGEATCSALIDCGASRNYISQDFMVRAGLDPRVRRKSQPMQVTLADSHTHKSIDRCIDNVPVYFAPHASEVVSFDILDTKFDMILGMSWLRSEDHPVNFFHRTVHIRDRNGVLVPCTVPLPHPSINCHVVSAASMRASIIRDDIEEMRVCFLHALPPHDVSSTDLPSDPRITELFDAYSDVFEGLHGTIRNAGPLPRIDDVLERLGGAQFFSKLDLKSGYHQLEIRKEDRYKTAFKTRYGHFEWLVMPFGLTNAPATFQAAMTMEFRHMLDRFVLIYLDDILVYSRSLDEHKKHLRTVLERLRQAKYKANRDKCELAQQELEYLGHYVTPQGIRPLADKIEAPRHDGDDWHPVEYFSHKVPPINSLDDARKKELLAFVMALKRWRHFLLGRRRFTWVTDNNPLTYYKTQDTVSSTIGRWMYFIDQFDFTPKHVPSLSNRAADALSRRPDLCAMTHHAFAFDEELQRHFIWAYQSDPDFGTLYAQLSSDHPPANHYRIADGYLLLHSRGKDLLCVPRDRRLRTRLLGEYHDSRLAGHFGVNRTIARLRHRFLWPDLITDVTRYCDSCEVCRRSKPRNRNPYGELHPMPIPREPGLSIAMDVTGPFPRDRLGHDGILTVVDRLKDHAKLSPSMSFIGGALAGTSATLGSYPFDLVRTILASQGEPKATSADHVSRPCQQDMSAGPVSRQQYHVSRPPAWCMLFRSQTAVMDQRSGEADKAYHARMLAWSTETKKRADDEAAAAKTKAEDAEQARLLALEQQRHHDEATARAADEERTQRREKIFSGEQTLLTMAVEWRTEAENGKLEDSENKIALLLSHLTDLLATSITQQEDIHSLDDSLAQVQDRLRQLEQRPVVAHDASSSNTSDRLTALEMDVGSLKDGVQLQQTTTQQLEQRICTTANTSSSRPRETTPKFDGQEIFCNSMKTDSVPWFRKFELTLQLHNVKEHKHHACLYSRSGGACQAWLDNLLSKYGVVAADLHTKINWDDLKAAWHKQFQVEPPEIKAMDKLMDFEQGTLLSTDWIAEYQRLTSVPDIQMGFKAVRHYFISRSCPTLSNALTHVEDTLMTTVELFDKAAQIIITNKEAKNLRSYAAGPSRDQHRPRVAVVAVATPFDQTSEVVFANERDRLAAARECGRPGRGRRRGKMKTHTASSPEPGFGDIFETPTGLVPDRPISHEIVLEAGAVPPKGCIYQMSEEELEVLRAQLDDLLAKGWIRPSSSPYGAPVLFVRKKNKDLRLCIDYRKLNSQTVKNAGPLPRIDDLLERLGGAKYFSKLDLKSGHHQISIRPNDRYKSAFKTWYGHFEWVVMPFGLTNAPATFQAAMTNEFRAMLDRFVLVYLDDILVYSRSLEDHLGHLRRVLEALRRAKYKANHDKCEFVRQELEYLGYFVTPEGISLLSDKIQAIQEWSEPRNVTDVRSFLGLAGYYQRFIKGYSKIAAHLIKLQCEDRSFDFGVEVRESFFALKAALFSAEVLRIYDPLLPTRVTTDALGYGIGAVREQHDGVDWHPVEYFSKKVPVVHSIDDARKKELLAFVHTLKRWQHFLLGRSQFRWVTDNNPLVFYKTQDTVNSTIARWMAFIDQFDFFLDHIPEKSNRFANALSRRPDHCTTVYSTFGIDNDLRNSFIRGYQADPEFRDKYANCSSPNPAPSHYRIQEGYLLVHTRGKDHLCVPSDPFGGPRPSRRRHTLLRVMQAHDLLEVDEETFAEDPSLGDDQEQDCEASCSSLAHESDYVDDEKSMNAFKKTAFKNWKDFTSQIYDIKLKMTSGRHPKANGLAEEINQTVIQLLRALIVPDQNSWEEELSIVQGLYNNSIHSSTGMTRNRPHLGWQIRNPLSHLFLDQPPGLTPGQPGYNAKFDRLLKVAVAAMERLSSAMIKHANKITVGSYVWVYANMSEAIVGIVKKKGIRGLYAGLSPTLVQIVPYAGLQFSSYDLMKKTCMMWNRKMAARKSAQRSGNVADAGNESLSSFQHVWCGLFAGTFSKACCHPLDVVRKRFQVRGLMRDPRYGAVVSESMYQGMVDCFRRILAEEGVAGLYKGTVPSIIKAAPAAAITFVVYETVCRWLTSLSVADKFGEHGKETKGGEVE
ncbi:hypothetical protein CBR_g88551 [Chara braunii]|uniref:RNA-directed DNA polymerase n=1 Tax=Chara braunii TaxID=69332 RepID=A0A388KB25_CHABU|nr:hypothetical protein CBR_g88551 [Chara braunii]|eukprot:GBG67262.1 hypothetical protein CBR_g88551 [Chara braunii]